MNYVKAIFSQIWTEIVSVLPKKVVSYRSLYYASYIALLILAAKFGVYWHVLPATFATFVASLLILIAVIMVTFVLILVALVAYMIAWKVIWELFKFDLPEGPFKWIDSIDENDNTFFKSLLMVSYLVSLIVGVIGFAFYLDQQTNLAPLQIGTESVLLYIAFSSGMYSNNK